MPPAVHAELISPPALVDAPWLRVQAPSQLEDIRDLGPALALADIQAIALAHELGAMLLTDDRAARLAAERIGIEVFGSLGLLLQAKSAGLIPEVRPLIRALQEVTYLPQRACDPIGAHPGWRGTLAVRSSGHYQRPCQGVYAAASPRT